MWSLLVNVSYALEKRHVFWFCWLKCSRNVNQVKLLDAVFHIVSIHTDFPVYKFSQLLREGCWISFYVIFSLVFVSRYYWPHKLHWQVFPHLLFPGRVYAPLMLSVPHVFDKIP